MEESPGDSTFMGMAGLMNASSRDRDVPPALPGGTVTLLLADLEGSVRLWETDRSAMTMVAPRLGELISEAVRQHGGIRPIEQGEGDSFVAAFERASDAVACAMAIQLATLDEPWPADLKPRFRMALHTGEAQFRDDSNYAGAFINRCARLRDIGHGGQVLVSRTTHDLVVDRLPEGATLTPIGAHRLRDLARPEDVFQLGHPSLPAAFPALRSIDAFPNNLPAQLTSFIGREREMAEIMKLLDENRIVTLTGAGGSGKTRLAVQVAAHVMERYPDGVWLADLAPVADQGLVAGTVATVLGVTETTFQPLIETIVARIRDKKLMLVLDNCEHLVSACAELTTALARGCSGVVVLATSREPLGVEGEMAWRVPSLTLPGAATLPEIESLTQFEAVRLFIDRALRARPNFAVTNDNAPAVAEICHRLDGIPLAIELAAARVRVLSPAQIAEGLGDRFRLLTGGARSAMPRQQTLEASVEWSHDLLSEDERLLLRRLSVFAGSFALDAAEAVCAGDGIEMAAILEVLSHLVDRSLVQVEDAQPATRYRLLETIRQYGRRKLADAGEQEALRDRHLEYFLEWAGPADANWGGDRIVALVGRHDLEIENLRGAMDWAEAKGATDEALRLTGTLVWLWFYRRASEGRRRLETALGMPGGGPLLRARAQIALVHACWTLGDMLSGVAVGREAVASAQEAGDERLVGRALTLLGWASYLTGTDGARGLLEAALEALPENDDYFGLAAAGRGGAAFMDGDWPTANRHLQEAVARVRALPGDYSAEFALLWMGIVSIYQGDFPEAERVLDEAVVSSMRFGELNPTVGFTSAYRGLMHAWSGRPDAAAEDVARAIYVGTEAGLPWVEWMARWQSAFADYFRGDYSAAQANIEAVLPFIQLFNSRLIYPICLSQLADILRIQGNLHDARARIDQAMAVAREGGVPSAIAFAAQAGAVVSVEEGELEAAEDLAHEALSICVRTGAKPFIVEALEALAGGAARHESYPEAARLFGAAAAARDLLGYRWRGAPDQYEAAFRTAKEALDEAAWEIAWAEGIAMDLDEAVAYAVRGRGERKRPSAGWASLTPTELDVVRLVAEGLTNKQIGERLFIATSTVKVHVSHIFGKLGISTRSDLAAQATRRQL